MKKMLKYISLGIGALAFTAITVITALGYNMYRSALDDKPLANAVEEIRAKGSFTEINELPQTYLNAILAVEDHRFYDHPGVDPIATARAAWNDLISLSLAEGGSTITQQLAKNMYFTQEKSFIRKVAELFMAFEIERNYEKDEILELYVNGIYFGSGYYSVREACEGYFETQPKDMTDYQCIMLAGIPNAPSVYSLDVNPELAQQRMAQVIKQMIKCGYIDENKESERALSA
ncbi:MAG: transglycosylase domain-containing protein [Ruminococcaceae bacterium]|nr:transglycosylase domain-containing protein [Oscillospiraceae bacterium]